MQENTLYIDTVETDEFYRWPKFSVCSTVWRDDVDDMVIEIFEDVPENFHR